ncbi:helix-turn-helix domain-containing protein [Candidatus Synechococcus spongiarum]|uniref:Uncharacterized protein n=1 Tax=Candidatus Synechococcus spongiarum TaxID=431041 RepID=A0A161KBB5_9SYNE|nr:helix-turn-helix transcriptional regulator [Candidatus Synechococcus spongiarum]CZB16278.1 hypothetical protein FLM9_708 [Candidatus Synechococcus spongiarum]
MRFPEGFELKTYGQQLLAGRQTKGWSQKQLSKKLFLPTHFIRALEAGEHGMLPEIPYVISMYRKVAMAVDVDPEPMIQACKAFQERERQPQAHQSQPWAGDPVQGHDSSPPKSRRQSREPPKPKVMAAPQQKRRADRDQGAGKSDGVMILVGCGMGLALVGAVLFNNELWLAIRSRLVTPDTEVEEVETGTETQDQASDTLAIQRQPIPDIPDIPDTLLVSPDGLLEEPESEPEQLESGTVRFLFMADVDDDRSSWIRIENAFGALLFESIPEPFTSVDLPATAGVRVRVGRPGLVRWQQPGQPPQPLLQPQADGWIELIPGPVSDQVAPTPLEAAPPLDPAAPAPEAP